MLTKVLAALNDGDNGPTMPANRTKSTENEVFEGRKSPDLYLTVNKYFMLRVFLFFAM